MIVVDDYQSPKHGADSDDRRADRAQGRRPPPLPILRGITIRGPAIRGRMEHLRRAVCRVVCRLVTQRFCLPGCTGGRVTARSAHTQFCRDATEPGNTDLMG